MSGVLSVVLSITGMVSGALDEDVFESGLKEDSESILVTDGEPNSFSGVSLGPRTSFLML